MNKIALAASGVIATTASAWAQTPPAKLDEKTLSDAYTYLLGRTLVIRQEHIDRRGEGFAYNAIKYNPLGSADFVNPNFDVAKRGLPSMIGRRSSWKFRRLRTATTPHRFSMNGAR
jgi:hypothetical protein